MEITKHDKKTYWLREELAAGVTEEGEAFTVSLNIDGACLVFMFPEATYTVGLKTITDEVMEFRKDKPEGPEEDGDHDIYLVVDEDDSKQPKINKIIAGKTDISEAWRTVRRLQKYSGGEHWDRFTVGGVVRIDEDDEDIISRETGIDKGKIEFGESD